MNKTIIISLSIIIVIIAIITGRIIYNSRGNKMSEEIVTKVAEEKIVDECTDEYEQMQDKILETNSEEEKISPNCFITLKVFYKQCGHETNQQLEIPEELVNKTKEEVKEKYKEWDIEKFSDTEIILSKDEDGKCGEHYIVRDNDGKVTIYEILEDGNEKEYEVTDISTEYLTDTDKINMEKGIEVYGKQNLNQLIEDFE